MRIRISQFCARVGICSRGAAKRLIKKGHVLLNGTAVKSDIPVKSGLDPGCVSLLRAPGLGGISVMLHKPECYLSTYTQRTDLWAKSLLIPSNRSEEDLRGHLDPSRLRRLLCINPLDYSASGLSLFSEDISLFNRFNDCEECYDISFRDTLTESKLCVLRGEIYLDGELIPPLTVEVLGDYSARIRLHGGSRKLRRICMLAGLEIRSIKRIGLGNLCLGNLLCGRWLLLRGYQLT
ncbi:S4 domain family protein [Babesia bovis T2Bo]|uniref:S4 domain family protein n=1 Tax=Babesia bovis T2Bo TaxID=484906 RepID=UPI001C35260C|nr:S4 domain family protein [Babesia bovis T2Bo]EDO08566.2 S4 domain family protein [Babesia bovis T2Bo]